MPEARYFYHPDAPDGLPLAARAGDLVFYGGGIAASPRDGVPAEVYPHSEIPYHFSGIRAQLRYVYDTMSSVLEEAGSSMTQGMKINAYMTSLGDIFNGLSMRKDYFGGETPPPSTMMIVPEVAVRGASVTTDLVALTNAAALPRQHIHDATEGAPLPPHESIWGHRIYVKMARGGGFIFTAGLANTAEQERSFHHPDFPYQADRGAKGTEAILTYMKTMLAEVGAGLEHVVRTEIYVNDMRRLAGLEEVWRDFFPEDPPARIIAPADFPTPTGFCEIEAIAIDPEGPYAKETISTPNAPASFAHEPQAVKAGPYLFLSSQMATDWREGLAPEARVNPGLPHHASGVKRQARYILKNVDAICRAGGASMQDLVRRRAVYRDLRAQGPAEAVWREVLGDRVPPTTTFKASTDLPVPQCSVAYDLVAYAPDEDASS